MAAEIRKAYPDAEIQLIQASGGRFEVMCDGTPIFQKSKLERHANSGEVMRLLRAHIEHPEHT